MTTEDGRLASPPGSQAAPEAATASSPSASIPIALTDFERDCLRWRGKLLTGAKAHWCDEWDGLPVDETTPEWPCGCIFGATAQTDEHDAREDAQGIEAGTAETGTGSVYESPTPKGDAP